MKYTAVILAFVATAAAQTAGLNDALFTKKPDSDILDDSLCSSTTDYNFAFNTVQPSPSKRDLIGRQNIPEARPGSCNAEGAIVLDLNDGRLVDNRGRTGSIVANNNQFQFDGPPQANPVATIGWCVLKSNGSLTLGSQSGFYNCVSGDPSDPSREFSNVYSVPTDTDPKICKPVAIQVIKCPNTSGKKKIFPQSTTNVPVGAPALEGTTDDSSSSSSSEVSASSTASSSSSSSSSATQSENIMSEMMTDTAQYSVATSTAAASTEAAAVPTVVAGNATAPAATGTGASPPSPTGPSTAPSPFVGAGSVVAAGQKILGLAVGVAAFALL